MIAAENHIERASDLLREFSKADDQRLLHASRLLKAQSSILTYLTPAKVHVLTCHARGSSEADSRGVELVTKAGETLSKLQAAQGLQEAMLASSASVQGAADALNMVQASMRDLGNLCGSFS